MSSDGLPYLSNFCRPHGRAGGASLGTLHRIFRRSLWFGWESMPTVLIAAPALAIDQVLMNWGIFGRTTPKLRSIDEAVEKLVFTPASCRGTSGISSVIGASVLEFMPWC